MVLQNKGKTFSDLASAFRDIAAEGEEVLASVQIGFTFWLLTNKQLTCLNMAQTKIKTSYLLSDIQSVRLVEDKIGQQQFWITADGEPEKKLGTIAEIGPEFVELFSSTLGVTEPPSAPSPEPISAPVNTPVTESNTAPEKDKKTLSAEKKEQRAKDKQLKKDDRERKAGADLEQYGREILSEMVGLKTVKFYEKGFTKVGMLGDFEKLIGIEGSADNLQKKSAAGRAAGFVFTGGLNMLGSNKRGDLLITITTDKNVHTLHVDAPYEHDLKSHHRIVSVGKSLLGTSRDQGGQAPAASEGSMSDEIGKLNALKEAGVLTDEEFTNAKRRLLGT